MSNERTETFDVVLQSYRKDEEIRVISAVRHSTNISMGEAKELVEHAPVVVCSGLLLEAAQTLKADLESGFWPGMRNFERLPADALCCTIEVRESAHTHNSLDYPA